MKKVIILAVLTLMGQNSWAQIRGYQTTRLLATSGAGVASILSTEAAILNPAAAAFFKGSSFSYQSLNTSLRNKSDLRSKDESFPDKNRSQGFFLADHSGPVKGGTAYITQHENRYVRESYILHGSAPMGKASSMGVSYSYLQDELPQNFNDRHRTHHRASLGFIHIIDESMILGLTLLDPTRTTPGEERLIGGFQYGISNRFSIIGDVGAQFTKDVKKNYLWRAALQLNLFNDFHLLGGRFYDDILDFKGTSWGVSWVGPRFGVEFAQRFSEQFNSTGYIYEGEKLVDTAFSALMKF